MIISEVLVRTRAYASVIRLFAIVLATFAAIMLSTVMPQTAYAGDTVKSSQCELTSLSAPKLNDTVASTGIQDMKLKLTFDCVNASTGPSTIVYSNVAGSTNKITFNSLMWLDTDDGAMADDAAFDKAGTYTLFIKATMPENGLDWEDSDALSVSLNGATIAKAEVTHKKGNGVYKLTMYLPFEVKGTPAIGSGNSTNAANNASDNASETSASDKTATGKNATKTSPKTGEEGSGPFVLSVELFLMGVAVAGWCIMRARCIRARKH